MVFTAGLNRYDFDKRFTKWLYIMYICHYIPYDWFSSNTDPGFLLKTKSINKTCIQFSKKKSEIQCHSDKICMNFELI